MAEAAEGFRNTDCHFFIQGFCSKGQSCPYRHSEGAKLTTSVCTSWRSGGVCSLKCSYRHPDKRFMGVSKVTVAPVAPAADRSQTPCHYFAQGLCKFGAQCQFKHEGVEAVSLHALARNSEQAPQPQAPKQRKDDGRAEQILNKFSSSAKAHAKGGAVTVRSAMPPSMAREGPVTSTTGHNQGFGTLGQGGASSFSTGPRQVASAPAPRMQPRQPPFPATATIPAPRPPAEKRKSPPTAAPPQNRVIALSNSSTSISSSTAGKADFHVPTFEEIIAEKRRKQAAEKATMPTITKPPVFTPAPSTVVPKKPVPPPVAAAAPAPVPVAAVAPPPQLDVPAEEYDDDLPSFDEDDGVFEEYNDLL